MCVKDTGTKYQLWIKAVHVLLLGGCADDGSAAGSGAFVGFFTTVKLD